jgi:hypothetical protein
MDEAGTKGRGAEDWCVERGKGSEWRLWQVREGGGRLRVRAGGWRVGGCCLGDDSLGDSSGSA